MDWTDLDALAERIETEQPPMIALGVLTDMTWRVRGVLQDEKLQKILHRDYIMERIGRYYIWYKLSESNGRVTLPRDR